MTGMTAVSCLLVSWRSIIAFQVRQILKILKRAVENLHKSIMKQQEALLHIQYTQRHKKNGCVNTIMNSQINL